ncbi:spore germination protein [Paenibacillus sp. MBLB4367]|uniref:spore germination protein n=1 Tax=Paenibacillus sp. MBLB4367 TaxID=3384767 RepID=UPI003907E8E2
MAFFRQKQNARSSAGSKETGQKSGGKSKDPLSNELDVNVDKVKASLGESTDLAVREIQIGANGFLRAVLLFTEGLADASAISRFMEAIMIQGSETNLSEASQKNDAILKHLEKRVLTQGGIQHVDNFDTLFDSVVSGDTVLLLEGMDKGLVICTKGWEDRSVQENQVQMVVRGPHEAFTENIRTNTALIRRRIRDRKLWLKTFSIGRVTKTDVAIMYIKGTVDDKIVEEVEKRLNSIDTDSILESGNIEEWIQDKTFTPFPTVFNTERPDTVAGNLLEGRVAILVDGTPVVLLVPVVFLQFLQSPEDYYQRSDFGIIRMLRLLSLFISLNAPAMFIAITTFHQEMLPTTLMVSIAAQREGVPFPAAVEAFLMEGLFEILREAGIRMPRAIGSAISIVGALVLGEAAVQAGLVSPAMVIVVSITAITSFVFPSFSVSIPIRILRFFLMGLAASFGLYGMFVGVIGIMLHMCSLRSFGIPYMAPSAPMILDDQKDSLIRVPSWMMKKRPKLIGANNPIRLDNAMNAAGNWDEVSGSKLAAKEEDKR